MVLVLHRFKNGINMGSLLDQLDNNAKIAQEENVEAEKQRDELIELRKEAEETINDLKKDKTEH